MRHRMVQSERQTCQRLAAACRNRKTENAWSESRFLNALQANRIAQFIHDGGLDQAKLLADVRIELLKHRSNGCRARSKRGLSGIHESLGVQEVGIDQAREQHSHP